MYQIVFTNFHIWIYEIPNAVGASSRWGLLGGIDGGGGNIGNIFGNGQLHNSHIGILAGDLRR